MRKRVFREEGKSDKREGGVELINKPFETLSETNKEKRRDILKHALFPQKLTKPKNELLNAKIYEIFKQVKVNIPLLDAIKHIPSYAKFLKDLCTFKSKLHVKETAMTNEN